MAGRAAGSPIDAASGELLYIRYKPTKDCVALWSFRPPQGQELLVSAKLFRDGAASDIVARPSFQRLAGTAASSAGWQFCPYEYLPARRLLLQMFPLDLKLPGLALATRAAWAEQAFGRALGMAPEEVSIEETFPVSYKAWHRGVIRYTVASQGQRLQYFAKVFRDDRGRPMVARLRALQAQLLAAGAPWEIAAPLAYLPEAQMLVLEGFEGGVEVKALLKGSLDDAIAEGATQMAKGEVKALLKGSEIDPSVLRQVSTRAAEGLAVLQQMPVDGLAPVSPRALLRWLGKKGKGLHRVVPDLAEAFEAHLSRLEAEAGRLPPEPMVLTHGAFRHTQMLICGDKLALLDLDGLRISGASADPGEFLGCLDRIAVRRPRLRPALQEMEQAFVEGLERGLRPDPRWLAWYRAAADVKHALRTFLSLSPKWPERTVGFMNCAERALEGLRRC